MTAVNDATFQQVLDAPLAIVEFWNNRCPNCDRFKPVYDDVASQMAGRIFMATANTDESQKSAGTYGITGVPTSIFFMDGKEVYRAVGAMSKEEFLGEISRALSVAEAGPPASESIGKMLVGGAALAGVVAGLAYLASEVW